MAMNDAELAEYLGIDTLSLATQKKVIGPMSAEERAGYDDMARIEVELHLWQAGLGPKPKGVIVCSRRHVKCGD